MNTHRYSRLPGRQRGLALVVITLALLLVATLGSLAVGRVGVTEQQIAGSDQRQKQIYGVAARGLERGLELFRANWRDVVFEDSNGDGFFSKDDAAECIDPDGDEDCTTGSITSLPLVLTAPGTGGAEGFTVTVNYILLSDISAPDMPGLVRVSALAQAISDTHVTKTISQDVVLDTTPPFSDVYTGGDPFELNAPPLVVEGCISGVTGTPDIHPATAGQPAIATTAGSAASSCIDPGHFDLHGGTIEESSPSGSLAQTLFGVEPAALEGLMRQLEKNQPASVYVVDDDEENYPGEQVNYQLTGGGGTTTWKTDIGTAAAPVILFFTKDVSCPKLNGGVQIHGLVYYDSESCSNPGWGGGDVYGTVAASGNPHGFNANSDLVYTALNFGGTSGGTQSIVSNDLGLDRFALLPGSWRDY